MGLWFANRPLGLALIAILLGPEVHLPGMRTVPGSVLGSGNFHSWRLVIKSFLPPFSTADSSSAVVSYWRKDVHLVLVNHLGSLPRLTDRLDMTIVVDWDKSNKQTYCDFRGLGFLIAISDAEKKIISFLD